MVCFFKLLYCNFYTMFLEFILTMDVTYTQHIIEIYVVTTKFGFINKHVVLVCAAGETIAGSCWYVPMNVVCL